ncbi:hypothetical protein [Manganibacter manganicus]|uniref:hypothetical protein n=1 Tax=Manganibacter manganicus TaxID=1873176 RepID=UPI001301CB79|nr:hypothetical protein [Pseudaminobacter manganicus]
MRRAINTIGLASPRLPREICWPDCGTMLVGVPPLAQMKKGRPKATLKTLLTLVWWI